MAGRTLAHFMRLYLNGYDLSGYSRSVSEFGSWFDDADMTVWTDGVKGYLPNQSETSFGPYQAVFDNTATVGLHALEQAADVKRNLILAIGDRAAPTLGDLVFCAELRKLSYKLGESSGAIVANMGFAGADVTGASLQYPNPFGLLLNPNTARTGANSANGVTDTTGATSFGGVFFYQITAGNGTATLSVDDSANNSTWSALSGATSGSITAGAGVSGVVPLSRTATVRQYLRYQLALGTATSVTFVSAFVRAFC